MRRDELWDIMESRMFVEGQLNVMNVGTLQRALLFEGQWDLNNVVT